MMASKLKMENLFSNLGIRNDNYLVLYDNRGSCDAARLWWILDYYGFQNIALLNGGLKEWVKEDSLSNESPTGNKSEFKLSKENFNERTISLEEFYNAINDSSLVIIDSRSSEEYSGDQLKKGAFDKGRIPGSINIDWTEAINYDEGTFKTREEIKDIYAAKGIDSTSNVVVYCHSGVRSAHTTFVLTEILGYKNVKNYDGSWIQWSYLKLPIERD
jgi:thiosulfate/3-mercaptopyruvate sulfurtransferase